VVVRLTSEGEGLFAKAYPLHVKMVRGLMGALGEREQGTLQHMLDRVTEGKVASLVREFTRPDAEGKFEG
jgi:DNA-binding MarR family transcriptional regulator